MKITTTATHELTFSVEAFWSEEGGMGQDTFGPPCDDLPTALNQLQLAKAKDPKTSWIITINTKTTIK